MVSDANSNEAGFLHDSPRHELAASKAKRELEMKARAEADKAAQEAAEKAAEKAAAEKAEADAKAAAAAAEKEAALIAAGQLDIAGKKAPQDKLAGEEGQGDQAPAGNQPDEAHDAPSVPADRAPEAQE